MKRKQSFANVVLLLCALIWGMAFVAQSIATDYVGAFTFLTLRSVLAVIVLLPVIVIKDRMQKKKCVSMHETDTKLLILGGAGCGAALFVASSLQQIGIQYTTAGRAGFLTSLYLIFVTLFCVLRGKKVGKSMIIGVGIATFGIYLMSGTQTAGTSASGLSFGDILMILCAICFAVQIMLIDYFVERVDPIRLSCMQFVFVTIFSAVFMMIFEHPDIQNIKNAGVAIGYAGIMSSGVAYTLQIIGQKYAKPAMATLLMSFESVFSMIGGVLLLSQIPSARELTGCILMFIAVLISQFSGVNQDKTITN